MSLLVNPRAIAFQTQAIAGKCPGAESNVARSLPKGLKIFPSARFQVRKPVLESNVTLSLLKGLKIFPSARFQVRKPVLESNVTLSLPKGLKIFPSARFQVRKPVLGAGFRFFDLARNDPNYNAIASWLTPS